MCQILIWLMGTEMETEKTKPPLHMGQDVRDRPVRRDQAAWGAEEMALGTGPVPGGLWGGEGASRPLVMMDSCFSCPMGL